MPSRRMLAVAALAATLTVQAAAAPATAADWRWPVSGRVLTPYTNDNGRPYAAGMHRGIDIAAAAGTTVIAASAGRVTYAGSLGSSGLTVAIETSDARHVTSYLHLGRIAVSRGAAVETGEELGEVGTTGTRSASEPHLHFGVRVAGSDHLYVDPLTLLPPPSGSVGDAPPSLVPAPQLRQAHAETAPATRVPAAPLTAPRSNPLPLPALRRGAARSPAAGRVPLARPAAVAHGGPAPSRSAGLAAPKRLAHHATLRPSPNRAPATDRRRSPVAGRPAAKDSAAGDLGKLISLAGLALLAAAIAGPFALSARKRLRASRAHLRRQRPQEGARPSRARLTGVSEVS